MSAVNSQREEIEIEPLRDPNEMLEECLGHREDHFSAQMPGQKLCQVMRF